MLRDIAPTLVLVALLLAPRVARAQSCCAGASAVTPGRLAPHEGTLFGVIGKGSTVLGSFDDQGSYHASPAHTAEIDLEQDLIGAFRVTDRVQFALLAPLVETWRRTPGKDELGAGIGDANLSARWDLTLAGTTRYVPGVAVLGGVTLPTGTPPDEASQELATDATGVGALQGNAGLAAEERFGPWLVSAASIVALRAARTVRDVHETLGPQLTMLGALVYSFDNDAALGGALTYTLEGDVHINGQSVPSTARHLAQISAFGLWPITDWWRVQGGVFYNPPVAPLGRNLPATLGVTAGLLRAFP